MKKRTKLFASVVTLVLALTVLVGCTTNEVTHLPSTAPLNDGGTLTLSVNPEIAIDYDESGLVEDVRGLNSDGVNLITDKTPFIGKETRVVVKDILGLIGEAGYFVEEVEGERKTVTIEIEKGSSIPYDSFIDDVVSDVKMTVEDNHWYNPITVNGTTDYGITDYVDTDYGPGSDGITDYVDTDYGPNNDGVTDYYDTDYGVGNDGITDYGQDDTDYGPNNDGVTDYNDTDYGPNNDGITDYNDTDYGPNNDGVTDYNDTDYGPNNDGVTDYSGNSNYGNSNYGSSNYSSSNYGSSDYD